MLDDLRAANSDGADQAAVFGIMAARNRIVLQTRDATLCAEVLARMAEADFRVSPTLVVADLYTGNGPAADAPRMRMVRRIEAAPVTLEGGMSEAYLRLRDAATHRLGGSTTRDITSVITGIFRPVLGLPVYTLREKIDRWRGEAWSRAILWDDILCTDLAERISRLEIPVHFFVGAHDLTAMPALSRAVFDRIEAPEKHFRILENSAHSPLFEEPGRARAILRGIGAAIGAEVAP